MRSRSATVTPAVQLRERSEESCGFTAEAEIQRIGWSLPALRVAKRTGRIDAGGGMLPAVPRWAAGSQC